MQKMRQLHNLVDNVDISTERDKTAYNRTVTVSSCQMQSCVARLHDVSIATLNN